jgi:mannose-1-phosphate guanylyltransferase
LAGGGGTRLWPLSRGRRPKPFLPLLEGGHDLLGASVSRLSPLIEPGDIYVVTEARHVALVRESAPAIPVANILGEPMGRNTAAAVALAGHAIDRPADEIMVVLPADSAIQDAEGFRGALGAAAERAAGGDMVTLGVEATEPATGYGYVLSRGRSETYGGRDTFRVDRFEEKPTPERAREMIAGGNASWNAGIFVWRRDTVLAGLQRHSPDISGPIAAWLSANPVPDVDGARLEDVGGGLIDSEGMAEIYAQVRATSIDYALLEPASLESRVAVVPTSFGWSDLGSWSALRDLRSRDGSVIEADEASDVIEVGAHRILVHATGGRIVAVVGLEDVIVVDTPDAVLILAVDSAQDVKQVVDRLKADGRDDLL